MKTVPLWSDTKQNFYSQFHLTISSILQNL